MKKIILPGLIDLHVHLRTPHQTWKENFYTGTTAALAGGFTTIFDMPNNVDLIDSKKKLIAKQKIAKKQIVSDIGFYFGSVGDNIEEFPKVLHKAKGLKLYLSSTTGGFIVRKDKIERILNKWPKDKVILLHAEDDALDFILSLISKHKNKIHVCHVSLKKDLIKILKSKAKKINITCGVTPHHLLLNQEDLKNLGSFGLMKPPLATNKDQDFLWKHLKDIDAIESDHAPHTLEEKQSSSPPFGVPGLETTLPLLLTLVHENKLTTNDITRLLNKGPKKILDLRGNTGQIEVEMSQRTIKNSNLFTKCGWSPFHNRKVVGKIKKVILRGKTFFENGKLLVEPGLGKII